eukprot:TRINITY_DN51326_c0_g1_i1.p1 TRINITY_DN51326_c0_g1~~TRINITY_DN51326_c0_g1_i1.p1  ORF type:complete len:302 (+),score=46.40 TRINITY_DN51326_c0_g1_i1:63-968(+)
MAAAAFAMLRLTVLFAAGVLEAKASLRVVTNSTAPASLQLNTVALGSTSCSASSSNLCKCTLTIPLQELGLPQIDGSDEERLLNVGIPMKHRMIMTGSTYSRFKWILEKIDGDVNCRETSRKYDDGRCFCNAPDGIKESTVKKCLRCDSGGDCDKGNACVLAHAAVKCWVADNGVGVKLGYTRLPFNVPENVLNSVGRTKEEIVFCEPWREHLFSGTSRIYCQWKPDGLEADAAGLTLEALKKACKEAVPHRGFWNGRSYELDTETCGRNMKLEKCVLGDARAEHRFEIDKVEGEPFAFVL